MYERNAFTEFFGLKLINVLKKMEMKGNDENFDIVKKLGEVLETRTLYI